MKDVENFINQILDEPDSDNVETEGDFGATVSEFRSLSLSASDWTVETLFRQIKKGNIEISPGFQRRAVWEEKKKSAFIESLILGIPVPQIVIAQRKGARGKYLVLDGKQRLLSIIGFYNNEYGVRDSELIKEIKGETYENLDEEYKDALDNATIRAVRLAGWESDSVLYTIFHRLNSGSVSLNTQELRSALFVGPFTTFADDFTTSNYEFAQLFSGSADGPDFRMRDIELLTRYCGITRNPVLYRGNLKTFLDEITKWLNSIDNPVIYREYAEEAERTIRLYRDVYNLIKSTDAAGKMPTFSLIQENKKPRFNRAVFDALCYPLQELRVRAAVAENKEAVSGELESVLSARDFIDMCTVTTKTSSSLVSRVNIWSTALSRALGIPVKTLSLSNDGKTIEQSTVC